MLFQLQSAMKSSQSALEPLELDELEIRLLPELELSLPSSRGGMVSATADRSARAIQRSLFMASMLVQGFSAGIRARGREKARELREKPLLQVSRPPKGGGGRVRATGAGGALSRLAAMLIVAPLLMPIGYAPLARPAHLMVAPAPLVVSRCAQVVAADDEKFPKRDAEVESATGGGWGSILPNTRGLIVVAALGLISYLAPDSTLGRWLSEPPIQKVRACGGHGPDLSLL